MHESFKEKELKVKLFISVVKTDDKWEAGDDEDDDDDTEGNMSDDGGTIIDDKEEDDDNERGEGQVSTSKGFEAWFERWDGHILRIRSLDFQSFMMTASS